MPIGHSFLRFSSPDKAAPWSVTRLKKGAVPNVDLVTEYFDADGMWTAPMFVDQVTNFFDQEDLWTLARGVAKQPTQ